MKTLFILASVMVLCCANGVSAQSPSSQALKIETIHISDTDQYTKDTEGLHGCFLRYPSVGEGTDSYVFLTAWGLPSKYDAFMKLNGKIITLKLVNSTQTKKSAVRPKIGSSFVETYRSGEIIVRAIYVVRRIGGESPEYSVTVVVTKGSSSKTLKTIGYCAF